VYLEINQLLLFWYSELASYAVKLLKGNAEMIEDYFSMEIDKDGNIVTIPLLYEGYVPYMGKICYPLIYISTFLFYLDGWQVLFHQSKSTIYV
jgi:hypothetical protein